MAFSAKSKFRGTESDLRTLPDLSAKGVGAGQFQLSMGLAPNNIFKRPNVSSSSPTRVIRSGKQVPRVSKSARSPERDMGGAELTYSTVVESSSFLSSL